MKALKKGTTLLLAAALAASLAISGCGNNGNKNNDTSGNKSGGDGKQEKITIFQSKVEIAGELEKAAELFTAETGIEAEVWGATGDGYFNQLKTKLTSGQGPSVFSTSSGSEATQISSYLYDMSGKNYIEKIAPGLGLEQDGKLVGIPYGIEGFGMVYNKNLIDPSKVTDKASFEAMLKEQKENGVDGIAFSEEGYFLAGHFLNTPFALQDDPIGFVDKVNNGEVKMADDPIFQEYAEFLDIIKANSGNPLDNSYDQAVGKFATGRAASIHQGNWVWNVLADYTDEMDFDFSMMPVPIAGNNKISVGVASYWAIDTTKEEAEINSANKFLEWLLTSESGKKTIVDDFKFLPAMTDIDAGDIDPIAQAVLDASNAGNSIPWTFNYWPANIVDTDLVPVFQEYFINDSMTGAELLTKLDEAWKTAVEKQG